MTDDRRRKVRTILRKAESTFSDSGAEEKLARDGIHVGEARRLSPDEVRALFTDEPDDARPSLTVTCYLSDTHVGDRGEVEDPLSAYVEEAGIGEWVGSGQGSIGERAFFDVSFAVVDLAKAIPLIKEKLIELGVGEQTELTASDGSVHRLK